MICEKLKTGMNGLFCANFGSRIHTDHICKSMWCAPCYTTHSLKGDEKRYKEAREGDHFMSTFRCDFCMFYMLKKRFPDKHIVKDSQLLCAIRRVTLDAFWANDTQMVYQNKLKVKRIITFALCNFIA